MPPRSLSRYCDLDTRHRLCNYKGAAGAYAASCLDNALAVARLVLATGRKRCVRGSLGGRGRGGDGAILLLLLFLLLIINKVNSNNNM